MIFNSIRGRLQLWYGLILVAVLVGFGVTAYQLERGRQMRRIDSELQRRVNLLASALRPPPRGGGRPGEGPPPEQLREPQLLPRPSFDEPTSDRPPKRAPQTSLRNFQLPAQVSNRFDEGDTNGFYFVMWGRDQKEVARSANAPAQIPPSVRPIGNELSPLSMMPPRERINPADLLSPRMRGKFREMSTITPTGESVLVGRSIATETGELRLVALRLATVGGAVLLLGLVGGWWIASRAIRPIDDISATATKISDGDLSQRIDVTDTDNELGRLANVLNSTFARLEIAFGQQRQFTSDAAHELRTPVSVMLTQTQTTLTRERSVAEYRETVEVCQRAAQRMRRLIESLLALARLEAGQEPMKRLRFDLAVAARDCVELIRPLAAERGMKLICEVPVIEGEGDPERMSQVISNLLINAIQYNREGGEVRVAGQANEASIALTVTDTGLGISAADLPHIFDRFFRADKSRTGSSGHAGLGLAISKAIVEAHGGTIAVVSQPGAGTTVTVHLPTRKANG